MSAQTVIEFDVSRGRHEPTSQVAHRKVMPTKVSTWQKIYAEAVLRGSDGITLKDICTLLGKEKNEVSPRLTELQGFVALRKGQVVRLVRNGQVRDGCKVLVADIYERGAAE